jgi:hypothetical protein
VHLRDAVDRGRGDEHDTPDAGGARSLEHSSRAVHVDREDLAPPRADRERGGCVDDDVGTVDELADAGGIADVSSELLHARLEAAVVQRGNVQGPDVVSLGQQPPSKM